MQCGLVIFMLLFAGQLGLTLRHRLFGIAIGFGVIASCELMFTTLQAYGTISLVTLSLAKMSSEIVAYIIWTSYMFSPRSRSVGSPPALLMRRIGTTS